MTEIWQLQQAAMLHQLSAVQPQKGSERCGLQRTHGMLVATLTFVSDEDSAPGEL